MCKRFLIFYFLLSCRCYAQKVSYVFDGKLIGLHVYDTVSGKLIHRIKPEYERLMVNVSYRIANFFIPGVYHDSFESSEDITPFIDSSRSIIAKKGGRYGLLKYSGEIIVPFQYDSINTFHPNVRCCKDSTGSGPKLIFYRGSEIAIVQNDGKVILPFSQRLVEGVSLNARQKEKYLKYAYIDNYLIVAENAEIADSIIHSAYKSYYEDSSKTAIDAVGTLAIVFHDEENSYYLKGGLYNVIDLSTMKYLSKKWARSVNLVFEEKDEKQKNVVYNLNSYDAIVNTFNHIGPDSKTPIEIKFEY